MLLSILIAGGVGCLISIILGGLDYLEERKMNRIIEWQSITPDGLVPRRGTYAEFIAGTELEEHLSGGRHIAPPEDGPPAVWGGEDY